MKNTFENYIYSLNVNELRKLILEIASDDFRKEIEKQQPQRGQNQKINKEFNKLKNSFSDIFEDEANLYIINNFERHVYSVCQNLRPFWISETEAISDMFAEFITNVGDAMDNNYLSEEGNYFEDEKDYEGNDFSKYIAEFLAYIPSYKRSEIGRKIIKAHAEVIECFDIFENLKEEIKKVLSKEEWQSWLN